MGPLSFSAALSGFQCIIRMCVQQHDFPCCMRRPFGSPHSVPRMASDNGSRMLAAALLGSGLAPGEHTPSQGRISPNFIQPAGHADGQNHVRCAAGLHLVTGGNVRVLLACYWACRVLWSSQ